MPSACVFTALRKQRSLQQQRRLHVACLPELAVPVASSARILLAVARYVALVLASATYACSSSRSGDLGLTDGGPAMKMDAAVNSSGGADGAAQSPLFDDCAAFCPSVDQYPQCSRGTPCEEWCPSVPNKGPATCSDVYDLRCVVQTNAVIGCDEAGTLEYNSCSAQKDALQRCVTTDKKIEPSSSVSAA